MLKHKTDNYKEDRQL